MPETASPPGAPIDPVGRLLHRLTRTLALAGGLVLLALVGLVVYSVTGRALVGLPVVSEVPPLSWIQPFSGDFELVELGTAAAVFAFLPYCQLMRGNVAVDFFTASAAPRTRALLTFAGDALYFVVAVVLAWRMSGTLVEMAGARYQQTTMILGWPIWWVYVPAALFTAVLAAVCAYCMALDLREAAAAGGGGRDGGGRPGGAGPA